MIRGKEHPKQLAMKRPYSRREIEADMNQGNPVDGEPCERCGCTRYVARFTGLWACRRCALERA